MSGKPKVSVIVPVYNTEKYIHRCLKSLCNQSYKNLEIILVDDGSTDDSGRLCDVYSSEDTRIKVVHQKNGGQGIARNTGLDSATGDYIAFVDSDDYIAPYMYEKIIDIFSDMKVDIVCFDLHAGLEDNYTFSQKNADVDIYEAIDFLRGLYEIENFDSSVLKVYKRELFNHVRFPIGRTMGEDVGTVYKLIYNAEKIAKYKKEIYYYYQSPYSTMRGRFSLNKAEECDSFKERLMFFKSIGEIRLYERALLQYEAVVLRSLYYIKKIYPGESDLILKLRSELLFARNEIKAGGSISPVKKMEYVLAAYIPGISGFVVSRLM